ncbi:MAG: hypothetical protein ACK2UU_23535 [Anaerolineae bacterium]
MDGLWARWASAMAASPLALWLGGSLLVYALGANLLWMQKSALRRSQTRWLVQLGRFAFYLVIPYLALGGWPRRPYQGLLSLEHMGIAGLGGAWPVTRWLEAAGVGLGWGVLSVVLLSLAWASANRRNDGISLLFAPSPWWVVLVDVLYLQVHWAFYRGALTAILDDAYAGVFLGLGLVFLESSLNPFWRQGWQLAPRSAERWLRASVALITALVFLLTRNLWVCLAVHLLLEFSLRQVGRERAGRRLPAPSSQQAEGVAPE